MRYEHALVTAIGGPRVLQVEESELPDPGPGEVRIRVEASGVAFADVMMRYGSYPGTPKPPFIPGYEVAGTIDALGDGVQNYAINQPVVALTVRGGNAQYINLQADDVVALPDGVAPLDAAGIALNYVTAYQLLHRMADVKPGQSILVHGAAGGVGTALLQLAALANLQVYGTASKPKHNTVRRLGATPIDYQSENVRRRILEHVPAGVDAVFDGIGGRNLWQSYRCLRSGGTVVAFGMHCAIHDERASIPTLAGTMALVSGVKLVPDGRRAKFYSIEKEKAARPDLFRSDLEEVLGLLAARKIAPVVATTLPLAEIAQAHELLEGAEATGKIVLICNEPLVHGSAEPVARVSEGGLR